MSERLDKAKAALHDAKKQDRNHNLQEHLLDIARTQATIAGAECLERIEEYVVRRWGPATFPEGVEKYRPAKTF
jgi:hypothetical protein